LHGIHEGIGGDICASWVVHYCTIIDVLYFIFMYELGLSFWWLFPVPPICSTQDICFSDKNSLDRALILLRLALCLLCTLYLWSYGAVCIMCYAFNLLELFPASGNILRKQFVSHFFIYLQAVT